MVSIRLPNQADVAKLAQTLYKEHRINVPVMTWNGVNLLRLSVQEYTSQAQVDKLVEVVVSIVKGATYGQG
jgi:selenocysteine lyase/cysteine desulfurase